MVPASLTRSARAPVARESVLTGRDRSWRPANIPLSVRAEMRALIMWGGVLGIASVIVALGYVLVRIRVVEAGYRLSATRQLVERLELEGRELEVQAAAADAPEHLAEVARTRLAMHKPLRGEEAILP